MQIEIAVIMDSIGSIKIHKDSTFAMLLEAQRRGWGIQYLEQDCIFVQDGIALGRMRPLSVLDDPRGWFELGEPQERRLSDCTVILMRKDPPFDMEYVYTTYALDLAGMDGAFIVNDPAALRDCNEKLFTAWFPQCCVPTLVSREQDRLRTFMRHVDTAVLKPLDSMGGESVFRVARGDPNTNVTLETLTRHGKQTIMAQRFIPEVDQGDKRILLIDGIPVPYALARIPEEGEARANLAAGGTGKGVKLSERDRWICAQVGPELRKRGLLFAGIDVIGDYLTEINVTSPTCIRELDALYGLNISSELFDAVARRLAERAGPVK
ncbi:MAG: glutathione synthase [Pseudomonadota bacterium]|nr:glutathione synthase [Pseudomonadota bacterium]